MTNHSRPSGHQSLPAGELLKDLSFRPSPGASTSKYGPKVSQSWTLPSIPVIESNPPSHSAMNQAPSQGTSLAFTKGSPTILTKRATYDPRLIASRTPLLDAEAETSSEHTLHPAIANYQQAHPRRSLINFGPYVLLQTLGEGEFGKVKLGIHKDYGEEVAVKLIRRGSVDSDTRLSKVEREISVLKVSSRICLHDTI
jgi:protein-serine/threonine kinase